IVAASRPTVTSGLSAHESSSRARVGAGTSAPAVGPARNHTTRSAYACGLASARGAEAGQAGGHHGTAQAEGEDDRGPGHERAEAGGELGAGQRRHVGQGPGQGQEHSAQQQADQAGVGVAAQQPVGGEAGHDPAGGRGGGPVQLGGQGGGGGEHRPGGVDHVGGHGQQGDHGQHPRPAVAAGGGQGGGEQGHR